MASETSPRIAVVVVGMHRSGTSALARALSIAGLAAPADVGKKLWESPSIIRLDNQLLNAFGMRWRTTGRIPPDRLAAPEFDALRAEAVATLGRIYPGDGPFVVKEPRMCRLLPFWDAALRTFGAEPRYAFAVRNPRDVASSLAARNEMGLADALTLWTDHVETAELATRGAPRAIVEYDELLQGKSAEIERLIAALALPLPPLDRRRRRAIDSYVSTDARHHASAADDLFELGAASVVGAVLYSRLVDGTPPPDARTAAFAERLGAVAAVPAARAARPVAAPPAASPKRAGRRPAADAAEAAPAGEAAPKPARQPKGAKPPKAPKPLLTRIGRRLRRLFARKAG